MNSTGAIMRVFFRRKNIWSFAPSVCFQKSTKKIYLPLMIKFKNIEFIYFELARK